VLVKNEVGANGVVEVVVIQDGVHIFESLALGSPLPKLRVSFRTPYQVVRRKTARVTTYRDRAHAREAQKQQHQPRSHLAFAVCVVRVATQDVGALAARLGQLFIKGVRLRGQRQIRGLVAGESIFIRT
jgi:hypothetical protein